MSYIRAVGFSYDPFKNRAVVNFAESIDTVPENIREVSPQYLLQFQGFGKSFIHRLQY